MPTATRSEYLTLGGLLLATTAIDAYDWHELMGSGRKRGADVTIPGTAGDLARSRIAGSHRGLVKVRINGKWAHATGASTGTTEADWVEGAYDAYVLLAAEANDTAVQTLQLVRPAQTVSESCIVEELVPTGRPVPWIWEFALDVKLPDGPLAIT